MKLAAVVLLWGLFPAVTFTGSLHAEWSKEAMIEVAPTSTSLGLGKDGEAYTVS